MDDVDRPTQCFDVKVVLTLHKPVCLSVPPPSRLDFKLFGRTSLALRATGCQTDAALFISPLWLAGETTRARPESVTRELHRRRRCVHVNMPRLEWARPVCL